MFFILNELIMKLIEYRPDLVQIEVHGYTLQLSVVLLHYISFLLSVSSCYVVVYVVSWLNC